MIAGVKRTKVCLPACNSPRITRLCRLPTAAPLGTVTVMVASSLSATIGANLTLMPGVGPAEIEPHLPLDALLAHGLHDHLPLAALRNWQAKARRDVRQ